MSADGGAGAAQLVERSLGVARLDVDASHRGAIERHAEALPQGVEGGGADAVVRGQADSGQLVDSRAREARRPVCLLEPE